MLLSLLPAALCQLLLLLLLLPPLLLVFVFVLLPAAASGGIPAAVMAVPSKMHGGDSSC